MRYLSPQRGVTLVELVMVIVIIGLVSVVALAFMQRTFVGYAQAREQLIVAEQGRLALNRFKRDVRLALPNSPRLTIVGGVQYLEFAPTVSGGRYRSASATGTDSAPACPVDSSDTPDNGILKIGSSDTCFKTLGVIDATGVAAGDWLVVFNAGVGYPGSNFYENGSASGGNKAALAAITSTASESRVSFASNSFDWESPGRRFHIAKSPVTYVCDPVAGTLARWSGYPVQAVQPTTNLGSLAGASSALLARTLGACQISYAPASIGNQFGLVTLQMQLNIPSGGSLSVQAQAQVSNIP